MWLPRCPELRSKKLSMGLSGNTALRAATKREPGDRRPLNTLEREDLDTPICLASWDCVIPASCIMCLKRSGENLFTSTTSRCGWVTLPVYGLRCSVST